MTIFSDEENKSILTYSNGNQVPLVFSDWKEIDENSFELLFSENVSLLCKVSGEKKENLNISAKDGHQISYNKDSNLWQIQNCPKPQATQKAPETTQATLAETSDSSALGRWWTNTDKFCTDGNDDGKLGIGEVAEFAFKGLFKGIRDILRNPVTSLLTTGILGGLTLLTGGAALPYILGAGIALGGIQTVIGLGKTYANWGNGKDKNTQAAIENMTSGMVTMALGIFGLKSFNVAKAGRSTPGKVLRRTFVAATAAPVCPTETTAAARPAFTRSAQTVIEESFFPRIEVVEGSLISTTVSA